jgi:hypothetical protein
MATKKHRGRIQAQGGGIEESESWAQDDPLTMEEGLTLLQKLKSKLSKWELKKREEKFNRLEDLMHRGKKAGGLDARYSQTFGEPESDVRVDVEILSGRAFVCVFLIACALIWIILNS